MDGNAILKPRKNHLEVIFSFFEKIIVQEDAVVTVPIILDIVPVPIPLAIVPVRTGHITVTVVVPDHYCIIIHLGHLMSSVALFHQRHNVSVGTAS